MHHWRSALCGPGAEARRDPFLHVLSAAALFGPQIMTAIAGVDGHSLPAAVACCGCAASGPCPLLSCDDPTLCRNIGTRVVTRFRALLLPEPPFADAWHVIAEGRGAQPAAGRGVCVTAAAAKDTSLHSGEHVDGLVRRRITVAEEGSFFGDPGAGACCAPVQFTSLITKHDRAPSRYASLTKLFAG